MERAKQIVSEVINRTPSPELIEHKLNQLKPDINNLLWEHLPKHVTMEQAEALSFVVFEMCTDPDQFFEKSPPLNH